jgi:hypothetical protein
MGKALDILSKLQVKEFDWVDTNKHDIGLIAEEVNKVLPEAVWIKDGQIEGLKPLTLIAVIIEAIKELKNGKLG